MEGNFGRDTYRSGYAAAPLISSTPVSHNHPLYRPCRIRQDDFCSSTKIAARYNILSALPQIHIIDKITVIRGYQQLVTLYPEDTAFKQRLLID